MEVVAPFTEVRDLIKEEGGETLKLCYQCGLCTISCPWNLVRNLPVHRLVRDAQLGWVELQSEDWWLCVTCGICNNRCPRGVSIIDIMIAIRKLLVPDGVVPPSLPNLRSVMTSIASVGNPWLQDPKDRANWAKDLDVRLFTQDTELLYFPCCTPAFDPEAKRIAQATVKVLKKVGANFGILGTEERCCGESVRKLGNQSLFENLANFNINTFKEKGVKKIIVSSPHCFHTFKNEYPELGGNFEVIHFVPYLAKLLKEGKLNLTKEYRKRVTYQDPCYLGRHNGIYDEPREILRSIPGLELVEMRNSHENAICCGGGGGRIWMETKKEEKLSSLRLEQAIQTGAEVLALACPYCMLNFVDSISAMDKGKVIEIKDIAEIVLEAI